jgi:DNA (cytosine-5)-methyltransferase 1
MDEMAARTYRLNHPGVPEDRVIVQDIRTLGAAGRNEDRTCDLRSPVLISSAALNGDRTPKMQESCPRFGPGSKRGALRRLAGRRTLDVLAGAPPCQGFSTVGFRSKKSRLGYRADADERNFLFEDLVKAALELRPRLFLRENVPGCNPPGARTFPSWKRRPGCWRKRAATGRKSGG